MRQKSSRLAMSYYDKSRGGKYSGRFPPRYLEKHANRSCCVAPQDLPKFPYSDFEKQYDEIFHALLGQNVTVPKSASELKEFKELCESRAKVDTQSQSLGVDTVSTWVDTPHSLCQILESIDEVDFDWKSQEPKLHTRKSKTRSYALCKRPKKVIISETPRVKVIAEQFYKFKKNDIELRKLDEKIVCVEYDVFAKDDIEKPHETMRVYFSIKPKHGDLVDVPKDHLEHIKKKLGLPEECINQPSDNEIEIIDGQIPHNKSYLDDIKKLLRKHKKMELQKERSSLDPKSLYKAARDQHPILESEIPNEQLQKAKDLILQKCKSNETTRKKIKSPSAKDRKYEHSAATKSILYDLVSESGEF